ncbi:hypothetical protein [Roseiarcus fermentans]|uniref:hypothetical protein n=1 Tax=Roseiarcus fermentans TaxID=1473586 RepID=UPI0011BECFCB|nr:hypothetical protein [Roseiarcus fermentans]
MKSVLLDANEGWDVWTDWYEARLDGDAGSPPNEALEIARATIPDDIWTQGPAVVNAEIKRLTEKHTEGNDRPPMSASFNATPLGNVLIGGAPAAAPPGAPTSLPHVPALRPASIEPIFESGRLTLARTAVEATLSGQTILASLEALAQSLRRLAEAAGQESNIDKRIAKRLDEISKGIPSKRPSQTQLFRLGHEFDELKGYLKIVAESWPELVAARYASVTLAFERTLRRFPKWVDFTQEPPIEKVLPAEAHDIAKAAETLADVLREPESRDVVDQVLPDAIADLSDELADAATRAEGRNEPSEFGREALARDILESLNNTLKRIAEGGLAVLGGAGKAAKVAEKKIGSYANEFGEGADESLRKSSRKAGDEVGPALFKLLKVTLAATVAGAGAKVGGPTLAAWLTAHYPQMYSWLEAILPLLK